MKYAVINMNTYKKKIFLVNLFLAVAVGFILLGQAASVLASEQNVGRYALIEQATGKVVNVILLDPINSNWSPPAGHIVIRSDKVGPGDVWDGANFQKAPPKEPEPAPPIKTDGNDIAEFVPVIDSSIVSGDVVALAEKAGSMRKSNKPYDKNLVGVISTSPGLLLGRDENGNSQKLALTGRVPVKVTTENGPILIGDALTSSSKPGVAMKATKPGTIIGKALEGFKCPELAEGPNNNCQGKIMILVHLGWYDPDIYLTSTGDLNIIKTENPLPGAVGRYILNNSAGDVIDRIGAFGEIAVANVKAGFIKAEELAITGNVGIGVSAPLLKLDVADSQASAAAARIFNADTGIDADGLIIKLGNTSTTEVASTNHFISFETSGIGIVGSISGNGGKGVTYATSGVADFAEYFRKDPNQNVEFGSVMCLNESGFAVLCGPLNSKILGIASERPAFLGGENLGSGSIAVGLVGQVETLVSNANGEIKPGDALTSSDTPGVAVKATKPGQIVGKAVEGFSCSSLDFSLLSKDQGLKTNDCQGKILVSVNVGWYDPTIYIALDGTLNTVAADDRGLMVEGGNLTVENGSLSQSSTLDPQNTTFNSLSSTVNDLTSKFNLLQSKLDLLSLQFDQQASISGTLAQIQGGAVLGASASAALALGDLELNNATIAQDLMVLGRTTVTDLGVTGNINAGLLAIHGLDGEINTLNGALYLQKAGLGGVNILAGKVVIDTVGNMTVAGTITAKQIEANNYTVLGQQSIGSSIIPAGSTSIEVSTTIASSSSKIFLTSTSLTDKQITVVEKSDGKFTVAIPQPTTSPISFDWWIVGNK